MTTKVEEKPDNLTGLVKDFLVPHSFVLTRAEQQLRETIRGNELARRGVSETKNVGVEIANQQHIAQRAAYETERLRSVTEQGIMPALGNIAFANMKIDGRLEQLSAALSDVGETVKEVGRDTVGIPTQKKDALELLDNNKLDYTETILMLNIEESKKVLSRLPKAYLEVLQSGLARHYNPEKEKQLSTESRMFLANLRRKMDVPVEYFQSLETAARHRILDEDVHHQLAKTVDCVRFGNEGINYGVRDLNQKTTVLVSQGDQQISQGNQQISQGNQQIAMQRLRLQNDQIAIGQRDLTNQFIYAGIVTQTEIAVTQREIAETQRKSSLTLDDIKYLAEEASHDRGAIRNATETTSRHTGELVRYSEASARRQEMALLQREQLISGVSQLESATQYYGERQVREMAVAQLVRVEQLASLHALTESSKTGNIILGNIDGGINNLTAVVHQQFSQLNLGVEQINSIARNLLLEVAEINDNLDDIEDAIYNVGNKLEEAIKQNIANNSKISDEIKQAIHDAGAKIVVYLESVQKAMHEPERTKAQEQIKIANSLIQKGKYDKAITCLNKAEEGWPDNSAIFEQRAWCYVLSEKPRPAEDDFLEAIVFADGEKQKETRVRNRLHLASLYYNEARIYKRDGFLQLHENKLAQALEVSRGVVDEMPENVSAHFALATYLAEFKLYNEALDELTTIIPNHPEVVGGLLSLETFSQLKVYLKHTIDAVQKKQSASSHDIRYAIAKDYLGMGNAESCFNQMVKILESDVNYFSSREFWKDDVFLEKKESFKNLLVSKIYSCKQSEWYAVATLALYFPGIDQQHIDKVMSL